MIVNNKVLRQSQSYTFTTNICHKWTDAYQKYKNIPSNLNWTDTVSIHVESELIAETIAMYYKDPVKLKRLIQLASEQQYSDQTYFADVWNLIQQYMQFLNSIQ